MWRANEGSGGAGEQTEFVEGGVAGEAESESVPGHHPAVKSMIFG